MRDGDEQQMKLLQNDTTNEETESNLVFVAAAYIGFQKPQHGAEPQKKNTWRLSN